MKFWEYILLLGQSPSRIVIWVSHIDFLGQSIFRIARLYPVLCLINLILQETLCLFPLYRPTIFPLADVSVSVRLMNEPHWCVGWLAGWSSPDPAMWWSGRFVCASTTCLQRLVGCILTTRSARLIGGSFACCCLSVHMNFTASMSSVRPPSCRCFSTHY